MSRQRSDDSRNQSWTYGEVASLPVPSAIEDQLLLALRRLTATLDVEGVCDAVLSGVEHVFGATSSWIMLHDPAKNALRTVLFRGRGAEVYAGLEFPADRGVVGRVFTRGEIQFVPDVTHEDGWFDPERVRASGLKSVFLIPLVTGDTRIGVLGLDAPLWSPTRAPTPLEVKRLEIFAAQAAIGLLNARLYLASQQDRSRLRTLLRERRTLRQQVVSLRDEIRSVYSFGQIVGESEAIRRVLTEIDQVASSDVTVLLLGETGTGKELLARALHERSRRAARPFVPVNCAALPETLVESEMFGYERGAFTDAHSRKPGRFELANRGTLFLDEIGDLPLNAQAKLLRVLQDGEVHRVGSTTGLMVDVRVIAATNQDLASAVATARFREDLFYRLSVFPIRIPPLRERAEDVPVLAEYHAIHCARRLGKRLNGIQRDALDALQRYSWPGNVRELQNVIERAVILTTGEHITVDTIRLDGLQSVSAPAHPALPARNQTEDEPERLDPVTLADAERAAITKALRQADGRISGPAGAAALLGLKPTTLHAKMKRLGVRRQDALAPRT